MRKMIVKFRILALLCFLGINLFAKITTIDIVSFNDFHGNVAEDVREKGKNAGMAKIVGYVNEAKKKNPNTIVVSGGDNYQGTAISNLTFGLPVTKMMKALNLTASAVGNHEFDWGSERIGKWGKDGGFDYLAANIYDAKQKEPVPWAKPYKIVTVDGIKIAFIGLSTEETQYQTKAEFVKNVTFIPVDKAASYWVNFLKSGKAKEGIPNVIIALTHVPSEQKTNSNIVGKEIEKLTEVKGLDAVITGHSHRTVQGYLNDKAVIQAFKYGRALGKLHIIFDNKKLIKIEPSVDMISEHKSDIIVDKNAEKMLLEEQKAMSKVLDVKIGELKKDIPHSREGSLTELGYWVANTMRHRTNSQIGITNGGGVRRSLYKGNITMGDMYEIMPFDNQVVVAKVTGKHLKKLIDHGIGANFMTDGQFAGLKVVYDPKLEYENRIIKITLEDGTPIKDEEIYTVATNDFIVGGGDRYDFSEAIEIKDLFIPIRDLLVDEIKKNNGIENPNISNILIKGEKQEKKVDKKSFFNFFQRFNFSRLNTTKNYYLKA